MGKKGEKRSEVAKEAATGVVGRLLTIGDVSPRGMFGGYGLFAAGTMFGLVNRQGVVHFRVDDQTRRDYEAAGAHSHGNMPYFAVPKRVLASDAELRRWATEAIAVADAARTGTPAKRKSVAKPTAAKPRATAPKPKPKPTKPKASKR